MSMKIGILGKKIGMTRVYDDNGRSVAVTVIQAGPCLVTQKKNIQIDGYDSLQLGFCPKKISNCNMAEIGHSQHSGGIVYKYVREFRLDSLSNFEVGQLIGISDLFKVGDLVDISGYSKGRGFQGVVKRYGFKGGKASHGSMFHRAPGSIGACAWPSRVVIGKKMPGRMGNSKVTKKNIIIVDICCEKNILVVKGSIPGKDINLIRIYSK